jgi:hypothetical protein
MNRTNSLNRTNSIENSSLSKPDAKSANNSLLIKYDGRPPINRTNSIENKNFIPSQINLDKNQCAGCDKHIVGQVITALGHLWHPEHFVCYNCNCSIGTNIFYEKDNKPYCENDYIELFSPKCDACKKPILDVCIYFCQNNMFILLFYKPIYKF